MVETKLDPKEEKQYERLKKLGQELHLPIPEAFLTLEVFDKDGKLIQRQHQRSHSWTRNAYNLLASNLLALDGDDATWEAGKLSIKDTLGTIRNGAKPIVQRNGSSVENPAAPYGYLGAAAADDAGIVVGSGTNAESFEDFVLQTPIAEGVGAGQLNHVLSEAPVESYGALTLTATYVRYLNNNSGGSIDVNEVGLICNGASPTTQHLWLQSRDKLASTVAIPDTGQLKVTYTIQLTYPS